MSVARISQSAKNIGLIAAICLLALAFQGSRGIWEPDEGYYLGAARSMVETGDWIVPQMNLHPFLEKPPVVYWGPAIAMSLFGFNEWAARLPNAIWFLLTAWAISLLGTALWDQRTGRWAAIVYATSPVPFTAANIVTPDTPLAFWATAGGLLYWSSVHARTPVSCWGYKAGLGIAVGVGVLTKGPAMLVFLFPFAIHLWATGRLRGFVLSASTWVSLGLAAVIGGSWYAAVAYSVPGSLEYFFDNQVWGRLVSDKYNRNPAWYAGLYVYLPILLLGSLPWSIGWMKFLDGGAPTRRGREMRDRLQGDEKALFLFLWAVVPLVVFCAASSKLPLYVLPLFVPLSLVSARCVLAWKPAPWDPIMSRRAAVGFAAWCFVLVLARAGLASWETERDTRLFWSRIQHLIPEGKAEIVAVDKRRYGLSFYAGCGVEQVSSDGDSHPAFHRMESLQREVHELPTSHHHHVFIARPRNRDVVESSLLRVGAEYEIVPGPFETSLFLCKAAPVEDQVVRIAAMGDTRTGDSGQAQLGSVLYHVDEATPLDAVVLLGDNLSFTGEPEYFEPHFLRPYRALLRNGVPFHAVLGNHDVVGGFSDFQLHEPLLGMTGKRYYTRVFGDQLVQFFFLDTNTILGDPDQKRWLIQELAGSTAAWRVAAMHTPLYGGILRRPEADENLRRVLEPILVSGGVDLTLAGHNHVYQRILPKQGIHHFIAGSGGKLDRGQLIPNDPDLAAGNDQVNVSLVLEFTPSECRFRAVSSVGATVDEGWIGRGGGIKVTRGVPAEGEPARM